MYRASLLALVLFFLAAACAPRQHDVAPAPEPGEAAEPVEAEEASEPASLPAIEEYFLWRADGPGGPVHLFGTIHGGVQFGPVSDLPGPLRSAIQDAELVVMELDLNVAPSMALLAYMMNPDEPLSQTLSPERWATLQEISPMPAREIDVMRPWFVYTLLLMDSLEDQEAAAVDTVIHNYALEQEKEMAYFETIEEQLQMMVKAITLEDLEEFLDDPQEAGSFLSELVEVYRSGDEEALSSMIFDHPQYTDAETIEIMLDDRNLAWMEDMRSYLERGDVFVAVGAAHLFGDMGLIELLRAEGVTVERVPTR